MDFTELFTPAAIAASWNEVASNRIPYLGEAMFPAKKQAGLDLKWIKGSKGLPVSLMPTAFDAKATFRDRIGLAKLETEMPFSGRAIRLRSATVRTFSAPRLPTTRTLLPLSRVCSTTRTT